MKVNLDGDVVMNRRLFLQNSFFGSIAVGLTACTCSEAKPKEPLWNSEVCAHCRMTLVDRDFAAQLVGPGYSWKYFDDLGCALAYVKKQEANGAGRLYVRMKGENRWEAAEQARYVGGLKTPMNFGFGAVKDGTYSLAEVKELLAKHNNQEQR